MEGVQREKEEKGMTERRGTGKEKQKEKRMGLRVIKGKRYPEVLGEVRTEKEELERRTE